MEGHILKIKYLNENLIFKMRPPIPLGKLQDLFRSTQAHVGGCAVDIDGYRRTFAG